MSPILAVAAVGGSKQMPCCPRWSRQVDFKMNTDKLKLRGQNLGRHFKLGKARNTEGEKYHCTLDLLFDRLGISCVTTDNFCLYLQKQTNPNWSNRRSMVQ